MILCTISSSREDKYVVFFLCPAQQKFGATAAPRTLSTYITLRHHYQDKTVNTMRRTTFMTGVKWQLSEMMAASYMSVLASGNGGTRQVAPSIFSNGILQAVGPLLLTICSCCLALGLCLLLVISSTKTVSHEA